MVLGLAADVSKGQAQGIGHQGTLCNSSCGNTGNTFCLRELFHDETGEFNLDKGTKVGEGERLAVVAIEGTLPSACPCEGIVGL